MPEPRTPARRRALALLLCLAACGGGVGTEGTGAGSVPTLAVGPIEGFGSIVVNGVHYDNDGASVDDGAGRGRGNADLRLGMTVEVEAGSIDTSRTPPRATAQRIRLASALLGPLQAVAAGGASLTLLGQPVVLDASTVLDLPAGGLAALATGQVLEVFGDHNPATGAWRATRVQLAPAGAAPPYRLRGPLQALDTSRTQFSVGTQVYSYAGLALPSGVVAGGFVQLALSGSRDAAGRWSLAAFGDSPVPPRSAEQAELRGRVTQFDAARPQALVVNGQGVDTSAVALPAGLALGSEVQVKGRLVAGTLVASQLKLRDESERDGPEAFEFEGSIATLDTTARTLSLQGRPDAIYWGRADLRVDDGSLAQLAVGRRVQGKGQLSADRSRIEATRLKFL
jgi:hypothetical protein